MKFVNILLLLSCVLPAVGWGETSLWRVAKDGHYLYVGGTVHVLGKADYPLPDEFEKAFQEAGSLVLEADLNSLKATETQAELTAKLIYPPGQNLKNQLSTKAYKVLADYCREQGMAIENLINFRPPLVVISLTLAKLIQLNLADTGVDQYFFNKARQINKPIDELESAQKQIETLAAMGAGQESEFVLSSVEELARLGSTLAELKQAWRFGNLEQMETLGIKPMRDEFPQLYQSLLVQRNQAWLPKIKDLLTTPEPELVLVGALHLAGRDGVLAQLKASGYQITKY